MHSPPTTLKASLATLEDQQSIAIDLLNSGAVSEVWIIKSGAHPATDSSTLYVWARGDNGPECMLEGPYDSVLRALNPS